MAFGVDINKHLSPVLEQKIHSYLFSSVVDPDPVIGRLDPDSYYLSKIEKNLREKSSLFCNY